MGRRAKDKQLVAQASRRRTVLQIDRVSRRETAEVPSSSGQARAINPTSITGIGLLGSYGDHSDDEEGEGDYEGSIEQNGAPVLVEESTVASTSSTGPHSEIDAKLADFFNEIASMDADTTTVTDERDRNRLAEEAVSSTTEEELPVTSVAEGGYEQGEDYTGNEGDMYPWQACLDETTNCYYYWNVETNEVQWEPPQQLLAVTDTQTTDSNQDIDGADNSEYYKEKGEEEVYEEQVYQGDENFDTNKDMDSEEKQDNASESDGKEANSKSSSDNELDGFELVDSWEDQGQEEAEVPADKKASTRKSEVGVSDEEVPAKKPKLVEAESDDSDDDFAAQLLEDTYEKGKQDVVSEQIMDLPEESDEKIETKDKQKDEETDADKPLLPPEVFKHLKKAETGERKEEKPVMDEQEPKYDAIEEDYRMQIMELTSVLSNKLDFLEVSRKGVSSLKVLLIEVETRISDWREGALDSRHFIHKLCEADKQLKQYEESAAPPGWTCHWDSHLYGSALADNVIVVDPKQYTLFRGKPLENVNFVPLRSHKRYYYTNEVTGDSQWEYPSEEFGGEMEVDAPSEDAMPSQIVASTGTSDHCTVPGWTYPAAYVPMVQGPVMPVVMATAPVVSSSGLTDSFVNPPIPGTEDGSEVIPFTASAYQLPAVEEPPPPPPGTDDLPPLPPVESSAPPPPPPEPLEAPPLPPGEDMFENTTAVVARTSSPFISGQPTVPTLAATPASVPRSLVDYSDLDTAVASPPRSSLPATLLEGAGRPTQETDVGPTISTGLPTKVKVKKKKKASKMGSSLLSSKARKVSSLVQKWQSIKQQEEPVLNSSEEEDEEIDPRKQIEDWKREHMASGQAAYNPNFEEIKGDWRERIRARSTKSGSPADHKDA